MSANQGELGEVPQEPEIKVSSDPPTRSDEFYIEKDSMVIFLVENKLFKVHRYYFTQGSEVFRGMFEVSGIESDAQDGSNDDRPIHLPEVTIKEFIALLEYFYQQPHARREEPGLSYYLNLVNVAHRFVFDEVFRYGVKQLEPLLPDIPVLDRIVCGDRFGLRDWLLSAYKDLLERRDLSVDEARTLGYDRLVRLIKAKEHLYQQKLNQRQSAVQRQEWCCNCCSMTRTTSYCGSCGVNCQTVNTRPEKSDTTITVSKEVVESFF